MTNQESLEKVKKLIEDNLEVNLSLEDSSNSIRTRRRLQHLASLNPKETEVKIQLESVLSYAFQAEINCPSSAFLFLELVCGKKSRMKFHSPKSKKEVIKLIESFGYSSLVENLLKDSLDLASSSSRIFLKKSTSTSSYIELVKGYYFLSNSLLKIQTQEIPRLKVACIDGYIENVSEIHHLLSFLSETKNPCLLLSRGLSNDVLNTLKVNNDRKTIQVYPYKTAFDLDEVNTIVDVATVSGADVISTTKGNLISSLNPELLGELNTCILTEKSFSGNSNFSSSVKRHVEELIRKSKERPELADILSKRIKSLSSECINICIPDDMDFFYRSSQIDEGIRIISSIMNNTFNPEENAKKFYDSFQKNFESSVRFLL